MERKEKKIVQRGSTITEQYIKLYYGDLRKNLFRKIKNIIVSFEWNLNELRKADQINPYLNYLF